MTHQSAVSLELGALVGDDIAEFGVLTHLHILEEDAVLDNGTLFHGDAGEQDGVDDNTVDAAAVSHQRVQTLAFGADIGRGLVLALGADGTLGAEQLAADFIPTLS